jgi:hypothetical protein
VRGRDVGYLMIFLMTRDALAFLGWDSHDWEPVIARDALGGTVMNYYSVMT